VTAIDRTAYPRLSTIGSGRELTEVSTPTGDEIARARERTHEDRHLLALMLLRAYQRLGYFPSLDEVPELAATHLRALVGANTEAHHTSERTAKLHRSFVRVKLGVLWQPAEVRKIAAANDLAAEGYPVDPDDLATISPYIREKINRRGEYVLDLTAPEAQPDTRLDLTPGALFPPGARRQQQRQSIHIGLLPRSRVFRPTLNGYA
jgi:hypothetical protein